MKLRLDDKMIGRKLFDVQWLRAIKSAGDLNLSASRRCGRDLEGFPPGI
jgi:hypothetical protein